jgi:hypothetical protein
VIRHVTISHRITVDPNVRRGVSYDGIMDDSSLKEKLEGNFSIPLASAFPLYRFFLTFDEHPRCVGHYHEPPEDLAARKAATMDSSIGNLLLSNLPGWSDLPYKHTSVTVHTSIQTAGELLRKSQDSEERVPGLLYRALPALNSKMVVSPAPRYRDSFGYALKELGMEDQDSASLLKVSSNLHHLFYLYGIKEIAPLDWPQFLSALHDIAFEKIMPTRKVPSSIELVLAALIKNKADLPGFLDNAFSPLNNGFQIVDYTDVLNKAEFPDNEIWFSSPCLMIEEGVFQGLSREEN